MAKRAFLLVVTLLMSLLVVTPAWAADGDLDTTFSSDGLVTTPVSDSSLAFAVAVQPDGKIVTAGLGYDTKENFALVRYNSDGSLDTSFGTNGKVTTHIGTSQARALAVAIQPDGKIVAAGEASDSYSDFALARYNSDGSLDTSFGTNGKVTTSFSQYNDTAYAVSIQPDGKIVAAGYATTSNNWLFALVRYNSDGSLDTSFDSDGKVTTLVMRIDRALAVAIQPDGKIVAAGEAADSYSDFALVRYNSDGSLDTSFGTNGKVTTSFSYWHDQARAVAIQPDGKIVAAGVAADFGVEYDEDFGLVRYNSDGSLDTSFDSDGKVTTSFSQSTPQIVHPDQARAVAIQPDGKIVAAGYAYEDVSGDNFALARYNSDGSLDTSFDSDGKVTTSMSGSADWALAIAIQPDGKIVAAGQANASGPSTFALARYNVVYPASVPPETVISSGPWVAAPSADATFSFFAGEQGSSFECRIDGGTWGACVAPQTYSGLAIGTHTFEVRAIDTDGYTDPTPASRTWTRYAETSLDSGPTGTVATTYADFGFSSPEGAATFECRLDSGAWAACASPKHYANLSEGFHTFFVRSVASGVLDPTPASRTWTVDTVAPQTTIDSGPSGNPPLVSFSSSEVGSTLMCRLDTAIYSPCTSPLNLGLLAEGSQHTFYVYAIDSAGNADGTPAVKTWTVDTTPPTTSIDSGPGATSGASVTFTFSTNEPSTFECQLDSGGWSSCTSPKPYSGLSDGSHTLEVRARDQAGNVDLTPATHTWVADGTFPDTLITSGPSGALTLTDAEFTFASDDATATFQCKLDEGSYASCSSPKSYSGLAERSHTFVVRAVDLAGNADPSPSSRTWNVYLPQILTGPSGTVASPDATFTFSADDPGATFKCSLDAAGYAPCTSPMSFTSLPDGTHTFSVKAVDAKGNETVTPASRTWTIDTTAPNTTVDSGPSGTVGMASASFTFSSEPGATFACRLDAGPWSSCTSPKGYTSLADGQHTFSVRATDSVGNTDPTPASRTWSIDTTPPNTAIDSGPSGTVNSTSADFTFSATEPSTFECKLDAGSYAPCTSPKGYTSLADGQHTFSVRATDSVGNNTDATPASRTWSIDTTPPNTAIDSGPSGFVDTASASFTFSGTDPGGSGVASYQCRLDAGSWGACTSPKDYSGLTETSHTFAVRAIDAAGNTDPSPASRTWTVDLTAPDTTIDSGPSGAVSSFVATFEFSGVDSGSGVASYQCRLDLGTWEVCISPTSGPNYSMLGEGSHTFEVKAVDAVGRVDASPASRTWTVDTISPEGTIDSGPAAVEDSTSAEFYFHSSEPGSFQCQLDFAGWGSCTSPKSYAGLSQGPHYFEVRAFDAAGNSDAIPAYRNWTVDTVAPETTIDSGPSGDVATGDASFTFTSEIGATFECKIDSGSWAACASPKTYASLSAGAHSFYARALDAAGNADATPASRAWTIDLTAPNTSISSGPSGTETSPDASFTFSGTDAASGVASFECSLDSGLWGTCTSPKDYPGLSDGSHTFDVRAIDGAGNVDGSPASRTWTVSVSPPIPTATGLSIKAPPKVAAGSKAKITGALSSVDATCTNAQQVALKKGTATLQTKTTSATGTYKFTLKIKKKTTVQVTYAGSATCAASSSAKKTIRVS